MTLTLNSDDARKADNFSSVIKESGKYVGIITRAEKLLSKNNVEGVGLSFKTDANESANYLDVYTVKSNGDKLRGYNIVQALLCCTRTRSAEDGPISFDKWDNNERRMVRANSTGYPSLMGKRVGLILQKELASHSQSGEDTEKLNIVAVFEASTGLMSSEILDNKTKAERIDKVVQMISNNPVRDSRKRAYAAQSQAPSRQPAATSPTTGGDDWDDDIPF